MNAVFKGTFENKIDTKGRTFIPAKLRRDCGDRFVLTKYFDTCIAVYTVEAWNAFAEKLNASPSAKSRNSLRFFFGAAEEVELDKQGRVLISNVLRSYAKIGTDVVIMGVGNHMEIWDKATWEAMEQSDGMQEDALNAMTELGL